MPHSPRHEQQKSKNLTLVAVLLTVVALLFVVSIVKISGA